MVAIALLTACGVSGIVILNIFTGHSVGLIFYVTTFIYLFLVTYITLLGLNKVRKGTTLLRTMFCLASMLLLLWLGYTVLQAGIQAGISKLNLDILNPSREALKKNLPLVFFGQMGTFISTVGWGLTDVNANVFEVF